MHRIFGQFVVGRGALGLLVLRLVMGSALIAHGWPKLQHATSWMGPGAPVPAAFQFLAAFSEFFGGLAFLTGLLTPLAALGVASTMLTALFTVHFKSGHPFVSPHGPSYESALGYFAVAILMMLTGPGIFSLDYLLFGRRQGSGVGSAAAPALR